MTSYRKTRIFPFRVFMNPILYLCFSLSIVSCRHLSSNESTASPNDINLPQTSVDSVSVMKDGVYCYRYMIHRDTYDIHLSLQNGRIKGNMIYKYFDKNVVNATFSGYIKEDILYTKYLSDSSKTNQRRQLNFKVRGNLLIEGEGRMNLNQEILSYYHPDSVRYEGLVYSGIDCINSLITQ